MKTRPVHNCCGQQRAALSGRAGAASPLPPRPFSVNGLVPVRFRYVGETGLTIYGPISGRTYRFEATGAELDVDGRDAYGFATVPVLRRVWG